MYSRPKTHFRKSVTDVGAPKRGNPADGTKYATSLKGIRIVSRTKKRVKENFGQFRFNTKFKKGVPKVNDPET